MGSRLFKCCDTHCHNTKTDGARTTGRDAGWIPEPVNNEISEQGETDEREDLRTDGDRVLRLLISFWTE